MELHQRLLHLGLDAAVDYLAVSVQPPLLGLRIKSLSQQVNTLHILIQHHGCAVGILAFVGGHDLFHLRQGSGQRLAQLIQQILADPVGAPVRHTVDHFGKSVNFAVDGKRGEQLALGILLGQLNHMLQQWGAVLVDQIVQRHQHSLLRQIPQNRRLRTDHIGQSAACRPDIQLLHIRLQIGRDPLGFDGDAQLILQPAGVAVVLQGISRLVDGTFGIDLILGKGDRRIELLEACSAHRPFSFRLGTACRAHTGISLRPRLLLRLLTACGKQRQRQTGRSHLPRFAHSRSPFGPPSFRLPSSRLLPS
ncbi:hypothetical protein D3C75_547470 [compost metagenome]